MTIYYHFATKSYLNTGTHPAKSIPSDAVEITVSEQKLLLAGVSDGKTIQPDAQGRPMLIDPVDDPNAPAIKERYWRDTEIERVKWLRERHRDELELSATTSLSADQYGGLLTYLQLLRDWPQSPDFPAQQLRPLTPTWIIGQAQ